MKAFFAILSLMAISSTVFSATLNCQGIGDNRTLISYDDEYNRLEQQITLIGESKQAEMADGSYTPIKSALNILVDSTKIKPEDTFGNPDSEEKQTTEAIKEFELALQTNPSKKEFFTLVPTTKRQNILAKDYKNGVNRVQRNTYQIGVRLIQLFVNEQKKIQVNWHDDQGIFLCSYENVQSCDKDCGPRSPGQITIRF
jgi:hypothetical protein